MTGLRPTARAFIDLAMALLVTTFLAGVWELLASQGPSSEFRIGVLPGPVAQLRAAAMTLALLCFAVAWLLPKIATDREPWLLVGFAYAGTIVTLGAMAYGATTGMYGVQIADPRADSQVLLAVRLGGQILLLIALGDLMRRWVKRRRSRTSDPDNAHDPTRA